jgi:SSS family solute:Na+ symporter
MLHPVRDAGGRLNELSWVAVLLGYPVLGIWYWCTDQTIVQRVLGARTLRDAQSGPIFAGFLKVLPVFIMVLPGILGYVLFRNQIGSDNDMTLPVLIDQLVPTGLKGVIAAGLLAALMSTVAGALNSSATVVAVDIVKRLWPNTTDRHQVTVGRISAVVVMILAMLWSTQGDRFTSIFEAINKIPMMFAPGITTVFLWGAFWSRGTSKAAIVTLVSGFVVGSAYFLIDLPFTPLVGNVRVVTDVWGMPFMLVGWWLFCFCSAVFVVTSLVTEPPGPGNLANLCWGNELKNIVMGKIEGLSTVRFFAGLLFVVMVVLYFLLQ